jgi:hypothetical protein
MTETRNVVGDDISQDLIQTLSLIYFIEQVFSDANPTWLVQQKEVCQTMMQPLPSPTKAFMDGEAHQAAEALVKSYRA